jgi:hypothetical protein
MSEFKWTDGLVMQFARQMVFEFDYTQVLTDYTMQPRLDKFKASKQPKPEWEILSYVYENGFSDMPNPIIKPNSGHWNYAAVANYPIHSVKRLSDNQTFTVGETVNFEGQWRTIAKFAVTETFMQVMLSGNLRAGFASIEKVQVNMSPKVPKEFGDYIPVYLTPTQLWKLLTLLNTTE